MMDARGRPASLPTEAPNFRDGIAVAFGRVLEGAHNVHSLANYLEAPGLSSAKKYECILASLEALEREGRVRKVQGGATIGDPAQDRFNQLWELV